jgi:hypothetical protein
MMELVISLEMGMANRVIPAAEGDCFRAAFDVLLKMFADGADLDSLWLAHGMVTGTGGQAEGIRYCHAWVEVDVPLGDHSIRLCLDGSLGGEVRQIPAALYYAGGSIDPSEVVRHSYQQALMHVLDSLHYGPWTEFPDPFVIDEAA